MASILTTPTPVDKFPSVLLELNGYQSQSDANALNPDTTSSVEPVLHVGLIKISMEYHAFAIMGTPILPMAYATTAHPQPLLPSMPTTYLSALAPETKSLPLKEPKLSVDALTVW